MTYCLQYAIIQTERRYTDKHKKGGGNMKKVVVRLKRKPTALEVAEVIIKAVIALAALITALKWW